MGLRFGIALILLAAPAVVRADVVSPGRSRVPCDIIIEVETDYSGYRFWLVSSLGAEPLEIRPDRPCRVTGAGRGGIARLGYVVAAPAERFEELATAIRKAWSEPLPPGLLRSEAIDFYASVPFYDSRKLVIDTYRLEFVPGQALHLVWRGDNSDPRSTIAVAIAGICTAIAIAWLGIRLARRLRGKTVATTS